MHKILFFTFLIFTLFSCSKQPSPIPEKTHKALQDLQVNVAPVKFESMSSTTSYLGKVILANIAEIRPQIEGVVIQQYFHNGDYVNKGDKLFLLNPLALEGSIELFKANLLYAKTNLNNQKLLLKVLDIPLKTLNAANKSDRTEVLKSIRKANAEVLIAKKQLLAKQSLDQKYVITSPISGFIMRAEVGAGELVRINRKAPLAVVRTLDPVYVDIQILKDHWDKNLGQNIRMKFKLKNAQENYPHTGKILSIQGHDVITLRAVVPNPDLLLLPEMMILAQLDSDKAERRLVIPENILVPAKNDLAQVWVMEPNQSVKLREVKVASLPNHKWVVLSGLKENEMIVIDHLSELQNGVRVRPQTMQAEEAR